MLRFASFFVLLPLLASCAAVRPPTTMIARQQQRVAPLGPNTVTAFPAEDAKVALRAAEGGLRSCSDSAVPRPFEATLRFEPTGRVGNVEVSPAAGRVASCVRLRLAEIAVRPFEGDPVTLRMGFEL